MLVRSPEYLDKEGNIKWPKADGFVVDKAGKPITVDADLKAGQIIDRYGNSFGKFTSPVENGDILAYVTTLS
ncbi:TNT domain-containing protein [Listeria welshimeri]|nr:TNT domain-containing protein [Listeria welshimeri]MBC1364505.1 TNT domain-containing protein [Listeria welshimeri]MBC1370270.1 TNT domain-containing protein [Listeria welshimeri]MBC1396780.1 TNT domain-containing protein [Listeria welshimeri]